MIQSGFYTSYPDIFFRLISIVRKKILNTLFSKIIKVYKNFRKTFPFKVSKFQKQVVVRIRIS